MYGSYYGFKEKPDVLTPDPGFLYLRTRHKAALNILECGVTNQAGFVVISGEVGSGISAAAARWCPSNTGAKANRRRL